MLVSCLRRGIVAGLLGGLLAGLFALVIGEKPLEQAIHMEEADEGVAGRGVASLPQVGQGDDGEVIVSRRAQRFGLIAATGVVGVALGGIFGVVFAMLGVTPSPWLASLKLGLVAWLAVALLPSLKYPANPPGVGEPATVGARSGWYLTAVLLSLATALATWGLNRRLRTGGVAVVKRHLLASVTAAAGLALVAALPATSDPVRVPAALLWDFRLSALGTSATLWFALAAVFGLLGERSARGGNP